MARFAKLACHLSRFHLRFFCTNSEIFRRGLRTSSMKMFCLTHSRKKVWERKKPVSLARLSHPSSSVDAIARGRESIFSLSASSELSTFSTLCQILCLIRTFLLSATHPLWSARCRKNRINPDYFPLFSTNWRSVVASVNRIFISE